MVSCTILWGSFTFLYLCVSTIGDWIFCRWYLFEKVSKYLQLNVGNKISILSILYLMSHLLGEHSLEDILFSNDFEFRNNYPCNSISAHVNINKFRHKFRTLQDFLAITLRRILLWVNQSRKLAFVMTNLPQMILTSCINKAILIDVALSLSKWGLTCPTDGFWMLHTVGMESNRCV